VSAAECRACRGDRPPAETLIAYCEPHWHLVLPRADNAVPRLPVGTHAHEPPALSSAEQRARVSAIRARLRP
jgi:hypothetical protein